MRMFQNKRTIVKMLIVAGGIALVATHGNPLSLPVAHAQQAANGNLGEPMVSIISVMAAFTTFMHIVLLIALNMVGYLMSTDFFNDPNMFLMLKRIWILSRDIMNLVFALMLIGVAFYTIIMASGEFVKSKIVHFVTAVILVNFSWFFPRVLIDVSNILTATIYSIPNMMPNFNCQTLNEQNKLEPCKVVTKTIIFPTAAEEATFGPTCQPKLVCYRLENFDTAAPKMNTAHATLNALAVNFARLATLAKVPVAVAVQAPNPGENQFLVSLKLMVSVLMVFFVQIALVFPLLGLGIGLLLRIIVLWATMAFMPFAFIGYVFNGKLGTNVIGFEDYIWKNFIGAVFLPVTIAIPLVIGFIMLSSVSAIPIPDGIGLDQQWRYPIIAGVSSWWTFLWMIAALMIIWKGAFDALGKFDAAKGITEKIKGYGEYLGGAAMQLPLLTPLPLPGGAGKMGNIGSMLAAPRQLADAIRIEASGRGTGSLKETYNQQRGRASGDTIDKAAKKLGTGDPGADKIVKAIQELKILAQPAERNVQLQIIQNELRTATNGALNVPTLDQVLRELKNVAARQQVLGKGKLKDLIPDITAAENKGNPPAAPAAAPAGPATPPTVPPPPPASGTP